MPLIRYTPRAFDPKTLATIKRANDILEEYAEQGYDLTLRQLYYQFVARALIANKDSEYKRLGSIINDARLAGLIDWDHITDRTRNLRSNSHWEGAQDMIRSAAKQFQLDKWENQDNHIEVWIEKDALVGVLEVACTPLDVPFFSCRGYTSQSEMWSASQRLLGKIEANKSIHIIHLGDHDPSGIDMSRDIEDRLKHFLHYHICEDFAKDRPRHADETKEEWAERLTKFIQFHPLYLTPLTFHRIALNMPQIRQYDPPPNPAKITDSRARKYIDRVGAESWELDALEPSVITDLIREEVESLRDDDTWSEDQGKEEAVKADLEQAASKWTTIRKMLHRNKS